LKNFSLEGRLVRELRATIALLREELNSTRSELLAERRRAERAVDRLLAWGGVRPLGNTQQQEPQNIEIDDLDKIFGELSEEEYKAQFKEAKVGNRESAKQSS